MVAAASMLAAVIEACLAAAALSTSVPLPVVDESAGIIVSRKDIAPHHGAFSISASGTVTEATAEDEQDGEYMAEDDALEVLQLTMNASLQPKFDAPAPGAGFLSRPSQPRRSGGDEPENGTEVDANAKSLVYIKIPKTGGSTLGGVCRRIGQRRNYMHVEDAYWLRNINKKTVDVSRPSVWANHGKRSQLQKKIDKTMPTAFYLTSVRNPAERCMAAYYHFTVGRRGVAENNTDRKMIHINKCPRSFELGCMRRNRQETSAEVFASYDFVLVTERFDESLLALRKAVPWLQLSLVDLLYLKAKESGKVATDNTDNFKMPEHVPLSKEPAVVQEALAERWVGSDDEMILKLAHRKLDRYGIAKSEEYTKFKKMLRTVEAHCRVHFNEDCLWNDNGCGQSCIDGVAKKHGWE